MSGKTRLNSNEIIRGAIEIIRQYGEDRLSARELAKYLSCSTQPILYHFSTMGELRQSVLDLAEKIYMEYIARKLKNDSTAIQSIAVGHTAFARMEPNLFAFLFLNTTRADSTKVPMLINASKNMNFIELISNATGLDINSSARLFTGIWWTAHGIATMIATKTVEHTDTEIFDFINFSYEAMRNSLLSEQYITA